MVGTAGQRNVRIEFEQQVNAPDGIGGVSVEWQPWGKRWAAKSVRGSGQENETAGALLQGISLRFIVPFDSALSEELVKHDMRLIYEGQIVDIEVAFDPDDRRRDIEIHGALRGPKLAP